MMQRTTMKSSTNLFCKTLLFVFAVVLVALSMSIPSYAEDIAAITEKLEKELPETGASHWQVTVKEIIDFLKKKEKEVPPLSLSIGAGFNGHKAGEEGLYKLDLKTKMTYDAYPNEFRFNAGTNVQLKNGKLQENVTSLLINYDHYLETWLEIYGFAERFSDSYMSILKRYETGGGIKLELDLLGHNLKQELTTYKTKAKAYKKFEKHITKILDDTKSPPEDKALSLEQLKALKALEKEGTRIVEALKKKYAWLSLGMAVTVLSELEKAEIETFADDIVEENGTTRIQETTKTTKIALDGEHRFRIVLRPSIVIRPWPTLSLEGMHYMKYPLGSPKRVDGRLDYRTDSHVLLRLILPKVPNWAKEVALIFGYHRHYDNIPARVPQSIIDENLDPALPVEKRKSFRKKVAEDTHEEFVFSLAIKF
jgi:hypothetical protein